MLESFLFFFFLFAGLLYILLRLRNRRRSSRPAVIDGSNLLYWKDNSLSLDPVREAVQLLKAAGYRPYVIFDANAGYLVENRYLNGRNFAKRLGLSVSQTLVAPRGQPADPLILAFARDSGGIVISRDRFRDWAEAFPAETAPGRVVSGGYRGGRFRLNLERLSGT